MQNTECYNFEEVCRTCLSNDIELKSVFSIYTSDTNLVRVVDFIRRLTSVKIAKGDGLPENLCKSCIKTFCSAYDFSQICIASDNVLRLQRKKLALQRIQNEIFSDSTSVEVNEVIFEYEESRNGLHNKETVDVPQLTADSSEFVGEAEEIIGDVFTKSEETALIKEILSDSNSSRNCNNKELLPLGEESLICMNSNFYCDKCDESFSTQLMLEKHKTSHNVNKTFRCDLCPKTFTTKTGLVMHMRTHMTAEDKQKNRHKLDGNNMYKCDLCLKSFTKKTYLAIHLRSHTKTEDKQHECDVCGERFIYSYLLQRHSYKHLLKKPFPCSQCDKGCYTAESLRRHMKTHDANYIKKKHYCTICLKEFPYPSYLVEHMKSHTGEKPFLCSLCGKGFRQGGALKYHMRTHTGYKPFKCYVCSSSFITRALLKGHIRRHTNERPHICDVCGVAFRQLTDMKSHHRLHSGERRVVCTVCGKTLSTKGQLTVHLRSHTGEKPFVCDVCHKGFTTRTILVKHYRIHTGEKPYECSICHRSFSQSGTLKTHLTTHKNKELKDHDEGGANITV